MADDLANARASLQHAEDNQRSRYGTHADATMWVSIALAWVSIHEAQRPEAGGDDGE